MTAIRLDPLMNRLILDLEAEPEPSAVIQVQKATVGLARFGTVQAIGPEVRDVKVGQRVLASLTAGVEVGTGVIMITEDAILGYTHE